jgi:hypothetical protein
MRLRANQVLSVKQARELLGDEASEMTDEEVQKLVEDFDIIAQYAIKLVQKFKKKDDTTD